jgi:hypothetical protein
MGDLSLKDKQGALLDDDTKPSADAAAPRSSGSSFVDP